MIQHRPLHRFLTLIPMLALLFVMISGCEEGSEPVFVEPVNDPAEAMISQAVLVEGSMLVALDAIRVQMLHAETELKAIDFTSPLAGDLLEGIVENTNGDISGSGITNESGIIVRTHPLSNDHLVGTSWADRSEVIDALAEPSLQVGKSFEINSEWTALYTLTIGQISVVKGVLFAIIDLDSLFQRNVSFAGIDTVENRAFFALDQTGHVLFSTEDDYVGMDFNDPAQFSEYQTAVADSMLMTDFDDGSHIIDLTDSPGGSGERYLGWVHMPLVNGRFWVLAASLPVEDE
jgi:hypothetical protein